MEEVIPLVLALLLRSGVSVTATPRLCIAPCDVRVQVRIDPSANNRAYTLEVSGELYASRSTIELAGADTPTTQPFKWFKGLPHGTYEVTVEVWSAVRVTGRAETTVVVD